MSAVYAGVDVAAIALTQLVSDSTALYYPFGQLVPTAVLLSLFSFVVVTLLYVPTRAGRLVFFAATIWVAVLAVHVAAIHLFRHPSDPSTLYSLFAFEAVRMTLPSMTLAALAYIVRPILGQITRCSHGLRSNTSILGLFATTTALAIVAATLVNPYRRGIDIDILSLVVASTMQAAIVISCILTCLSDHLRLVGVVSAAVLLVTASAFAPTVIVTTVGRLFVAAFLLITALLTCGPMLSMRAKGFRLKRSLDVMAE